MTKPTLTLHNRTLTLCRYPYLENDPLQAWDSADEYLIQQTLDHTFQPQRPILILNDAFGALSCWFSSITSVVNINDSHISRLACRENALLNANENIRYKDSLHDFPNDPQMVLIKLPKNNRLLVWQLCQLARQLPEDCVVIAAAKAKDIHTSTLKLFEKYLGETTTSLAKKKSRLIFCTLNPDLKNQPLPAQKTWDVPEYQLTLSNHANVFSGESLDLGGRFLLEYIPQDTRLKNIIDLGCGNGVLGIQAARLNPQATVLCVDESHMAIASCLDNANRNLPENHCLKAMVNDCLTDIPFDSADLILCNPPFHQQNAITDHVAWQMLNDAKRVLRREGKLRVIGNRHLGYDDKVMRAFANVRVVANTDNLTTYESQK